MSLRTLALANLKHSKKNYAMYFAAMSFCVFTTYSFLALLFNQTVFLAMANSWDYSVMLISFGIIILVFVLFFLVSSNNSFIRARKKNFPCMRFSACPTNASAGCSL
jgi:putative ABC transport system permease protein